jgi:WD40 repeat protein
MTDNRAIWSIDFSPDGSQLVLGRSDRVIELWQLPTNPWEEMEEAHLIDKFQSQAGFILSIRFHPDGERIAVTGLSGLVELRDATSNELLLNLQFSDAQNNIKFTPDGKRLIIVSFEGIARILALDLEELVTLAQSRVTRSLTTEECQTYLHLDECPETP